MHTYVYEHVRIYVHMYIHSIRQRDVVGDTDGHRATPLLARSLILRFRVQEEKRLASKPGLKVQREARVAGSGFRVQGSGFRVQG